MIMKAVTLVGVYASDLKNNKNAKIENKSNNKLY